MPPVDSVPAQVTPDVFWRRPGRRKSASEDPEYNSFAQWINSDNGLSKPAKEYMRTHWLHDLIDLEDQQRKLYTKYVSVRCTMIIAGAIVPALASVHLAVDSGGVTALAVATIVCSLVVAIATGIESFLKFGDRWQQKANTAEALRGLGWSFILLQGDFHKYADHHAAFGEFCRKVDLLIEQNTQRVAALLSQQAQQQDLREPEPAGTRVTSHPEKGQGGAVNSSAEPGAAVGGG